MTDFASGPRHIFVVIMQTLWYMSHDLVWHHSSASLAAWNVVQVEEVDSMLDFEEMLANDDGSLEWEKEMALGSTELVV